MPLPHTEMPEQFGLLAAAFCYNWGETDDGSSCEMSATNVGDLDSVPTFKLWLSPALVMAGIWGLSWQLGPPLSLVMSIFV